MWYNYSVNSTRYGGTGMRVTKNVTSRGTSYYIIRSVAGGSSEIVEKLGTEEDIKNKYHCTDALAWAKGSANDRNGPAPCKDGDPHGQADVLQHRLSLPAEALL